MTTFLAMNGYGFFVWSAYGIAAIVIVIEILLLRTHRKAVLAQARSTAPEPAGNPLTATE